MQYRMMFMDALRNVTDEDLFAGRSSVMTSRLALAGVAAPKRAGHDQDHETVILEPSYGQLNYYSPVLVALAREYGDTTAQYLALWDGTLGALQQTRFVTPNGEWLLFDWGGYAYAWFDPEVKAEVAEGAPLSFEFPSVGEAYVRGSYEPGAIVVGTRRGATVVHAGGRPVYVETQSPAASVLALREEWRRAVVTGTEGEVQSLRASLSRPGRVRVQRRGEAEVIWWCYGPVEREGNMLRWEDGTTLEVKTGEIVAFDPQGFHDEKIVGMGLLKCVDPTPMVYPQVKVKPVGGEVEVEVTAGDG